MILTSIGTFFYAFITNRATKLDCIAAAMGKPVASRDSAGTIIKE